MIYLDNNATTQVLPEVLDVILSELSGGPANPSSSHFFGREAKKKLSAARELIAAYLKAKPQEILFTSGGTEGLNLLLRPAKEHIITSNVEHSAVYRTLQGDITYLPVGTYGAVTPEAVKAAITDKTTLIVLSAANNETGVKTNIEAIGNIALQANIPFIVDGVALLGKEHFTIPPGVSAMVFSGHKIHAPKGIGFIYVRSNFKLEPLLTGGDQEFSKRAGTENLAGILGLAKAVELINPGKMETLRDYFEDQLKGKIEINGTGPRICNTSNLSFTGVDGETLLIGLDQAGIAASHGSACASGALEPSRILQNMGLPRPRVLSSLRFSLSRFTTQQEIDTVIQTLLRLCK